MDASLIKIAHQMNLQRPNVTIGVLHAIHTVQVKRQRQRGSPATT